MRFGLGWTEIFIHTLTLTSKEIGTTFNARQPSPPWFPYLATIVWPVSRRLGVLSRALYGTESPTSKLALSSTTTHSVSALLFASESLSVVLIDASAGLRWTRTSRTPCRSDSAQSAYLAKSDVVRRGISAAGIQFMLAPTGHDRGDGKLPEGMIVQPYSRSHCLICDATCVNTYVSSNMIRVMLTAGSVADAAE